MTPHDVRRTAIHEAGHAVIAHALGLTVAKATIVPDVDRDGSVMAGHAEVGHPNSRRVPRVAHAKVALAGTAAERAVFGDVPPMHVTPEDLAVAKRHLARTTPPAKCPTRASYRIARILWMEDLVHEVDRLAVAYRPAIRRVADALLERETLTGEEVDAIVSATP